MSLMNQAQFAKHIGSSPGYVSQLKASGRLVMQGLMVDVEESKKRITDTLDPGKVGVAERHKNDRQQKLPLETEADRPGAGDEQEPVSAQNEMKSTAGQAGSAYQQARAMKEKYNAMQAKIAYEKEVALLLVASDVAAAVADGDVIIRNRLESLPDLLAPQLAAESNEQKIRSLLIDQIEILLGELSRTFYGMVKS